MADTILHVGSSHVEDAVHSGILPGEWCNLIPLALQQQALSTAQSTLWTTATVEHDFADNNRDFPADGAGPLLQDVCHEPRQQPQQQRAEMPREMHGQIPGRK